MENILDIGTVSYQAAKLTEEQTTYEKFVFGRNLLIDIVKVLVLSIPHWFVAVYRLIVSPTKKSVNGQTVLITGGGNGIGRELAFRFAAEGCNIAIADVDFQAAKTTAEELDRLNIVARAYQVDITDTEQIRKLKVDLEKDMPPVDILVNNAGIVPLLSLREGTDKEVERIIDVNVTAQVHVTRTFLPGMIHRKRGHIVGLSSISAMHPMGGAVIYCTTKGAMQNLIIALSEELRQEGNGYIKCTSILPYIVTSRKDIIEAAHYHFPLISPSYTAKIAVDAILQDELMVTIPRNLSLCVSLMNFLPFPIQMLFRDFVLKEKGMKLFSEDNKTKNL